MSELIIRFQPLKQIYAEAIQFCMIRIINNLRTKKDIRKKLRLFDQRSTHFNEFRYSFYVLLWQDYCIRCI